MSTITLPNIRVSSDLTIRLKLKDGGVAIDWSTLQNIRVSLYADDQRSMASRCNVSIDEEDSTILVCQYAANKMQYLGVNRVIVQCKYLGEVKTYDKPAFTFVRWTSDQEGEQITIDDPDVDVEITVEDVSSSILQEAVDAAFDAADRANDAAAAAEHMVDIHTGPEGKSAYEVAVEEGYTGTEEEWLASLKGPVGETPDISIGTVTTVEPGTPAAASMTGTPEAPVLNLSIPKGLVGATPNFTVGTVTTGEPGSSVIVTITGTPEAPVLNLTIPQGMQGNTGSSVDYPYELVNNLTTNDATKGLSAAQGYVLDGKVSQLELKVSGLSLTGTKTFVNSNAQMYFSGINIPAGSPFKVRVSSANAVWTRLFVFGNNIPIYGQWYVDGFLNGEWREISAPVDVTGICIFPHTITTYGDITLDVEYDGEVKLRDEEIGEEVTSIEKHISGANDTVTGWINGTYIANNQAIGAVCPKTTTTNSAFRSIIVPVYSYAKYIVNGTGENSSRLWAFLDKDDKVISQSTANASSTNNALVLTPPEGATQLVINSRTNENCYVTINGLIQRIELVEGSVDSLADSPSVLYAEVDSEGRSLRTMTKDAETHFQPQKFTETVELSKKAADSLVESIHSWGIPEVMRFDLGTPAPALSIDDADVTVFDNRHIGYTQIVKVSRDMYYMYYTGYGTGGFMPWDSSTDSKKPTAVLFAHSTDGLNWVRGFPTGVTPPFGETAPYSVKFIDSLQRNPWKPAFNIFRVPDSEYPFRCMTSEGATEMYKSTDGFTFVESNFVEYDQVRDTQPGVIVRGDICKVYHRGWTGGYSPDNPEHGWGDRNIVVFYTDKEGNMLCQETPVVDGHYYNSGASVIDDRRDLLVPTHYYSDAEPIYFDAFIVDGTRITKVDIDSDMLLQNGAIKFGLFCCGIVASGGKTYLYYTGTSVTHNQIPQNVSRSSAVYRVEIMFKSDKLKY